MYHAISFVCTWKLPLKVNKMEEQICDFKRNMKVERNFHLIVIWNRNSH